MRSIKAWLETLPDGYRERALKNMHSFDENDDADAFGEALNGAFFWAETPEGPTFWAQVCRWSENLAALPPLPEGGAA